MNRKHLVTIAVALVALGVVAAILVVVLRPDDGAPRTRLQEAVALAPADSQRLSWTDWAGVRDELGTDDITKILNRGFDADLTSTSALVASAEVLDDRFGFSPATLEWELFSQSETGAVITMKVPHGSTGGVVDSLQSLGFTASASKGGVWSGGPDLLAGIDISLTPELGYFAVDAKRDLVMSSDTPGALERAVGIAADGSGGPDVVEPVEAIGSPLSAAVYTGAYACNALAMAGAGDEERAAADQLLAAAGPVNPMTGFAIAAEPDGQVRVAMSFESGDQARTNADTRAVLAAGPAPGQGGDFSDRFELGPVAASGDVVTMELRPTRGAYVLSDLSSGPVLFATC